MAKFTILTRIHKDIKDKMRAAGWTNKLSAYETWLAVEQAVTSLPGDSHHIAYHEFLTLEREDHASLHAFLCRLNTLNEQLKG